MDRSGIEKSTIKLPCIKHSNHIQNAPLWITRATCRLLVVSPTAQLPAWLHRCGRVGAQRPEHGDELAAQRQGQDIRVAGDTP